MANFFQQMEQSLPWLKGSDDGSNFMQQLLQQNQNDAPLQPTQQTALTAQQPNIRQPRERHSVLDTVGRISDVLARVGGAEALYQPTLDAREDRTRQVDLDALRKTLLEQQVAAGGAEAAGQQNALLGNAVRGLQAIQARGGDISRAWPILAKQAGIPDDRAAQMGQIFADNPDALHGFASMLGAHKEFGLQPFYAQGADGKLQAYQLGKDGTVQAIQLGEGEAPIDPLKFVDLGGSQAGFGTRSGAVQRILPKTEAPGRAADRASRITIAGMNNRSREGIAAANNETRESIAATKGNKGGNPAQVAEAAAPIVADLRGAIERLHSSGGMSDAKSGVRNTLNVIARENVPGYERLANPEGYSARQDLDRLLTVGIPSLLPLMGGLQLGGKNMDAAKELETWRNSIASAKDYPSAIRAVEGFEARIRQLRAAPVASPRRFNVRPAGNRPTVSNW